jgi:sugar phosphate isomerase/epimerase
MIKTTTPVEEVQAMHKEAAKRGLKVLSVFGDFSVADSLEAGIRGLKQLIDHTVVCECSNLMLGGTGDEKLYQTYYKTIAECCDYAAAKGVGLSIKPHGGQNATGSQCRKVIELVGKKNFGLWYDPGNIFYYSDGKLDPVEDAATVNGLVVGMSEKGGFTHGPLIVECLARGPLESVKTAATKARQFLEQLTGQKA